MAANLREPNQTTTPFDQSHAIRDNFIHVHIQVFHPISFKSSTRASRSSITLYVLTHHHFNIIGLDQTCTQITYHDRIDISGRNLIHFCLGTPKHVHEKLFSEYNLYYGFSKMAAYFTDKAGDIYVCSPVIPDKYQCSIQMLEEEEAIDDELHLEWLNQCWNISVLSDNTSSVLNESILNQTQLQHAATHTPQAYISYDATTQFIRNHRPIERTVYKLHILQSETASSDRRRHSAAVCTQMFMLDLDSFCFHDRLKTVQTRDEMEAEPINIYPIFVRIWSDHSIDIVCCTNHIHPSWRMDGYYEQNEEDIDALVVYRNYLDLNCNVLPNSDDEKERDHDDYFVITKCVQNLNELILGHSLEGLYRLKMAWLDEIPFALNEGLSAYVELLQHCESSITQIPLFKFYAMTSSISNSIASRAILSDLCILSNHCSSNNYEQLLILDEYLKKLHVFALHHVRDIHTLNASIDIDRQQYLQHEHKSLNAHHRIEIMNANNKQKDEQNAMSEYSHLLDLSMMKEFDGAQIEEIERNLHALKSSVFDLAQYPQHFSLSDPNSLRWFLEHVKRKLEKQVIEKLKLAQLIMNERSEFIANQMSEYVVPQIKLIDDKMQQIAANHRKLKSKMHEIGKNHEMLQERLKSVEQKMDNNDNQQNHSELLRFRCILEDYEREYQAAIYDFQQLDANKMLSHSGQMLPSWSGLQYGQQQQQQSLWEKQEMLHLQNKIKYSVMNSHEKLKLIEYGLHRLNALQLQK